MPIWKVLSTEGENKTIHYLLCGEYELTNTSWSRCSRNTTCPITLYIQPLKEKEDPADCSINRKEKDHLNKKL